MSENDDEAIIHIDEDIPYIEYYELLSIDEILKTNPNFIAFSKEEIYNELFNFVKTKSKTENFLKLFYEIINKKINVNNFIIIADANRGEFEYEIIEEFINDLKKYDKINDAGLAFTSKNKLWFPLKYDANNDKIRFKANQKTIIELSENNNFIVFKDDETNIPVMAVYFYSPVTILNDYLNDKISDHLYKPEKLEILNSTAFESFEDLISNYKIPIPIHKINNDNYNYVSINNLLLKYNYSLDNISQDDFKIIKTYLDNLNANETIEKITYNSIQIKAIELHNPRFTFFNILKEIKVLVDLTLKSADIIVKQLQTLNKQKYIIKQLDITRDLYSIITNITDKNYDNVIKNLKDLRYNLSTNTAINTLELFKTINKKSIISHLDELEIRFELLKYIFVDIYKLNFICTDDEHEIYIGNDETNYEGIPIKIGQSNEPEDNYEYDENIDEKELDETQFEKYYTNIRYTIEAGFLELLKLVLPYIFAMQQESPIPINYDTIVLYLFNKYRTFDPKIIILAKYLPDLDEDEIIEYSKKSIKYLLITAKSTNNNKLINAINKYFDNFKEIMYDIIGYWSIIIQKDIVHNTFFFNQEKMPNYCDDLWDDFGAPYNMESKKGIVFYLSSIFKEVYIKNYTDNFSNLLEFNNDYIKIILANIKINFNSDLEQIAKIKSKQSKVNKGRQYYDTLVDLITKRAYKTDNFIKAYIDALIYMPSLKYVKIHKYLQGCCLERIDENFTADLYLKTDRMDLKKAKERLTGKRVFNMPRYKRFFLKKKIINSKPEQFIEIQNPIIYDIISIDLQEWISQLKNTSTVFTTDVINSLSKSIIKTADNYKELYMTYFNNKELKQLLHKYSFENYKQLASIVSKTLFKYLKNNAFQFITIISNTLIELDKLNSIITDDNIMDIINIRRIAIIRIFSLPSSPESVINKKFISSIEIDNDIYQNLCKEIYQNIINNMKNCHMLDVNEQIDFINQIREKNKFDILARMNKKTREDKDIEKELKKYGLQFNEELLDNEFEPTVNNIKQDEEIEGEAEYELEVEDDDGDDEFLSNANYGFIYAQ